MTIANRWIVGITGASGIVYARRLLEVLIDHVEGIRLDVVLSDAALRVMQDEEKLSASIRRLTPELLVGKPSAAMTIYGNRDEGPLRLHNNRNIGAPIASGSFPTRGMVIVPCSMKTLAAIASGCGEDLMARAADVVLKEDRRLILVPRETPLSAIHLENMLKLARAGAKIVPAMPGFYHQPRSIADLVDLMVMRIVDQMHLDVPITRRWGEAMERSASPV